MYAHPAKLITSHYIWLQLLPICLERLPVADEVFAFRQNMRDWQTSTAALAGASRSGAITQTLQTRFTNARLAYKRVEWLAALLDESAVKRYINGAPLPSVEQKVADLHVLMPQGFQIMEEQLYAEPFERTAFAKTLDQLSSSTPRLVKSITRHQLGAAELFAAARFGLVRIFTMGVTGFDTPAGVNTMRERVFLCPELSPLT